MKLLPAQPQNRIHTTAYSGQHGHTSTRLHGRWFVLACVLWLVLVALGLLVYIVNLPVYFARLQTLCAGGVCVAGQLTPDKVKILQSLGFSLELYAISLVAFNVVASLVWFVIGLVLFWRKTDDWMALLVSLTLMLVGAVIPQDQSTQIWQLLARLVDFLGVTLLFLVFCLFPNGKFVPRWMCWLPVMYLALNVLDFFPNLSANLAGWLSPFYFLLMFGCAGTLGVVQIYRYRYRSSSVERQQTKWVVFSTTMIILGEFVFWMLTLIFPSLGQLSSLYDLFFSPITNLLLLLIPLSLGSAILRYRLWEIDVLINRTLVYGTLTVILALVYFGSVVLLQQIFHALTGQDSLLAVVVSTLAIALPFQPLQSRLQLIIDRRFYRRKYDAAQTLATFGSRLHLSDEMDLTTLTEDMLEIVKGTMQPKHASLWLCEPVRHEKYRTAVLPGYMTQMIAAESGNGGYLSGALPLPSNENQFITSDSAAGQLQRAPQSTSTQISAHSNQAHIVGTVLSARWLFLARLVWLVLAVLTLGLFVAAIPLRSTHLQAVCTNILCGGLQPVAEVAGQLHSLGLTVNFYTAYSLTLQIVFALGYFIVAAIIFWRTWWGKSNDEMALLVSFFLVTFVLAFTDVPSVLAQAYPTWWLPIACAGFIGEISLPLCFYLFPNGRFVPHWTRWLLFAWIAWAALSYFFPNSSFRSNTWFLLFEALVFVSGLGSLVFAQVYRYRYVSNPIQRQQTKWVVFGMVAGLGGFFGAGVLGFVVPHVLFPLLALSATFSSTIVGIIAYTLSYLAMLLIPLSIAFALLRYRLWDIDMLVNRTLIYGTLIGTLGLIFLGSVITQERLLQALIGQASELVVVGSTLVMVGIFQPLRQRISAFISPRFYPRKYEVEQTLAAFSVTLRDEVDLDRLSEQLMEVVNETMQPTLASLWMRKVEPRTSRYTRHLRM